MRSAARKRRKGRGGSAEEDDLMLPDTVKVLGRYIPPSSIPRYPRRGMRRQHARAPRRPSTKPLAEKAAIQELQAPMSVKDLSSALGVKANQILLKLMAHGAMFTVNALLDRGADTAGAQGARAGHRRARSGDGRDDGDRHRAGGGPARGLAAARAGGDVPRTRGPRQNVAARPHPEDRRGRARIRRHHAAHRREPRDGGREDGGLPRYARPRGVHRHARARRERDGHRRARRRRRRRRDAADRRGD